MGYYTEFCISFAIRVDSPAYPTLRAMVDGAEPAPMPHLFFATERWRWMLRSGGSAYFDGVPHVALTKTDRLRQSFSVHTSIKNYDNEVEHFLDWICPHVITRGFVGFVRGEDWAAPRLVYFRAAGFVYMEADFPAGIDDEPEDMGA